MSRATPVGSSNDRRGGIGGLLRASRLRCGEELDDIAQVLRIRRRHLQAIEEGEFEQLPGATYAVGFIRAYADYLGLDSDEVVRRFKEEQAIEAGPAAKGRKAELVFPSPMAESGIPRGAVVFLGVVIGVIAYGGWYVSTVDNDFFKRWIEPVPSRLAALLPGGASDAAPDRTQAIAADRVAAPAEPNTAPVADKPAEATVAAPAASEAVPGAAAPDAQAAAQPMASAAEQKPDEQKPAEPATATAAPAEVTPTPARAVRAEPAPSVAPATAPAVETAATPAPQSTAPAQPAAQAPVAEHASESPAAPATTEVASTPVESAADTRIRVMATSDSWVEIRERDSDAWVWGKLLRAGESYNVPDRKNLKLKTGNAGGLEITVDGIAVPAVGHAGDVVRNVLLDPDKLKAGTAVAQ